MYSKLCVTKIIQIQFSFGKIVRGFVQLVRLLEKGIRLMCCPPPRSRCGASFKVLQNMTVLALCFTSFFMYGNENYTIFAQRIMCYAYNTRGKDNLMIRFYHYPGFARTNRAFLDLLLSCSTLYSHRRQ